MNNIISEYTAFLAQINVKPACFVPISGTLGVNITHHNKTIPWYDGKTVLDALEDFQNTNDIEDKPFRMPVQDVYKFTRFGDSRRIIAGTILTGSVSVGDELLFFPSGKKSTVKSIEVFNAQQPATITAPCTTGLTLSEQIYITRGELAVKASEQKPCITSRIKTSLFWLGKKPMTPHKDYYLKIGTDKMPVSIEKTLRVLNADTLQWTDTKETIDRHEVAECILQLSNPVAFDTAENNPMTSRFVIIDNYEISGGGIILQDLDDSGSWVRNSVYTRNYKWEKSGIPGDHRAERLGQNSAMIVITGKKDSGKKATARALEKRLFDDGKIIYFLGIGNVLYGVDADIKGRSTRENDNTEHIRRLAEIAHIMMDAGIILVVTAIELQQNDIDIIKTIVDPQKIETIWIGDKGTSDLVCDLYIENQNNIDESVSIIKDLLQEKSIIFKPSR